MGIMKNLIQGAIGAGAKSLMGAADAATGGLASKLSDTLIKGADSHAGLIGKVASGIGQKFLSDKTRSAMSNIANKAIDYLPSGSVKTALSKINDAAQGKSGTYAPSNSSPSPLMNTKPSYTPSANTKPSYTPSTSFQSRGAQRAAWNNPSHSSTSGMGND